MDLRLIMDPPACGSWNMALDEALLHSLGRAGQGGCLRFYFWDQPTLSLGYFQSHRDRGQHAASGDCPLVRRSTGGGAIVHARELTYSFAAPAAVLGAGRAGELYAAFHDTLIQELAARGLAASRCRRPVRFPAWQEPFLCFLRRAEGDVLLEGHKVAGSAQRRHRQGLLQHGSILLDSTPAAPELPGIAQIAGVQIDPAVLAQCWADRLAARLGLRLKPDCPSAEEIAEAEAWRLHKFADAGWTHRR